MDVRLLGINHHTAPLELRERLALDGAGVAAVLRDIRSDAAVAEAVLLATCNRTELYVAASNPAAAEAGMRRVFERLAGDRAALVPAHAYAATGEQAARHLLRVAAGLDSMILGEHQVLGQVREAQSRAHDAETLGPLTHRLWSCALHAGKRARAETNIGMGAVSVAQAAVCLAERAVGELRGRHVLVIGAGDTCRLAARHVADRRPARLWVANRTLAKAAAIAEAFGGDPVALDSIGEVLPSADAVISATRAPGFVLTAGQIRRATEGRPGRPLALVDVAMPRDIDPACADVLGAALFSIDAVRTLVDRSLAHRVRQIPKVEAILEEEGARFAAWTRAQSAAAVVRELVGRFEQVREEEVRRNLKHFQPEEEASLDRLTRAMIARLLRPPITRLTSDTLPPAVESVRLDLLRELFGLDPAGVSIKVSRGAPSPSPVLRLGTRGGDLAAWQASEVARLIVAARPGTAVDIRVIRTAGDREASTPVARIGGTGIFTREIEVALQEGAIDIAVHSLKDLPTRLAGGLVLAAIPERADPRDVLVAAPGSRLENLRPGARIGTSSMRRRSQLLARHPHLSMLDIRGNVPRRLARLDRGEFDALVLARAGLVRLGLDHRAAEVIEADAVLPAPGQGALAVESRAGDERVLALLQAIDHAPTHLATSAERALLARVEGGCQAPVGALGIWSDDVLNLTGVVASADGRRLVRAGSRTVIRSDSDAARAGAALADRLLRDGAFDILEEIRGRGGSAAGPDAT